MSIIVGKTINISLNINNAQMWQNLLHHMHTHTYILYNHKQQGLYNISDVKKFEICSYNMYDIVCPYVSSQSSNPWFPSLPSPSEDVWISGMINEAGYLFFNIAAPLTNLYNIHACGVVL